jgi:hypothetical protein
MQQQPVQPLNHPSQLPEYLGFGRLDHSSIWFEAPKIYAEYSIGADLVYRVELAENGCRVWEYFEGHTLGHSHYPTLQEAFYQHRTLWSPELHPRLQQITQKIAAGGVIHFHFPKLVRFLYFPAGLIFSLYLPVMAENREPWERLQNRERTRGKDSPLHIHGKHGGAVLRMLSSGVVSAKPVQVVSISSLLVELEQVCKMLIESGALLPAKEYPLVVAVAPLELPHPMVVWPGEPGSEIAAIGLVGLEQNVPDPTQSLPAFVRFSTELLGKTKGDIRNMEPDGSDEQNSQPASSLPAQSQLERFTLPRDITEEEFVQYILGLAKRYRRKA